MVIELRTQREGRGWEARASVTDVLTVRRYGTSEIRAMEAALSSAVRRVYEIMEDGQLALNDVFPLTFSDRDGVR
jgi:hypothetical protein